MHCVVLPTRHCKIANFNCCAQTETYLLSNCSIFSRFVTTLLILRGDKILISLLSNQQEVCKASTGREINFFSDSHLAPKFFKVVANSKEVGCYFQRQTSLFFYANLETNFQDLVTKVIKFSHIGGCIRRNFTP